jgi:transposase
VEEFVEKNTPQSATAVVEFVRKEFGKEYTVSAIVALLHRLGFIYKKPKLVPGKADPEKQEQFLKEIQQIQEELGEEDVLFYADGVHPQHNTKAAYGWFRRGDKQQLPANSGRERMNINGALNAKDLSIAIDISNAVNSQSTIHLLQGIERKYLNAKRIVIVCDNAPYNRSKMVKEFLKGTRIEMKFLPPYSPNLNLIERVWRFMNKKVRDNKYYEKFEEFKEAILDFFKNFSAFEAELMSLLVNKFRIIRV